jgi:hypothetical protein
MFHTYVGICDMTKNLKNFLFWSKLNEPPAAASPGPALRCAAAEAEKEAPIAVVGKAVACTGHRRHHRLLERTHACMARRHSMLQRWTGGGSYSLAGSYLVG